MKKIVKSFESFNDKITESTTKRFGPNDFKEYREEVDFWEIEHKKRHFGAISREDLWKAYVKPGLEMSLVELGEGSLASVLHKGNEIIKAVDEGDNEVKLKLSLLESSIKEYRKYRIYENISPSMSFTNDEYQEYSDTVKSWEQENGRKHRGAIKTLSIWKSYVKPGVEMTLVDIGDKMVSVLHKGIDIIMAFDQDDKPVEKSMVIDRMSKFFE
jgi:hypothetical protein